jgi:hypothetical protein
MKTNGLEGARQRKDKKHRGNIWNMPSRRQGKKKAEVKEEMRERHGQ